LGGGFDEDRPVGPDRKCFPQLLFAFGAANRNDYNFTILGLRDSNSLFDSDLVKGV
jgi:hypothetical protein